MIETIQGSLEDFQRQVNEFSEKVFAAASISVEWMTAPIAHLDTETKDCIEIRTGLLLEIGDMRFLVTAAHGLMDHAKKKRFPQILLTEPGLRSVPLILERFWLSKDPLEDIAVCQLVPRTIEAIAGHYTYHRLIDVLPRKRVKPEEGLFLLLGYPWDRFKQVGEGMKCADTWKYLTNPFKGDYAVVANYNADYHLILDYQRDTFDGSGTRVHPPGLSGCGIWFVGSPKTHPLFTKDDLKLVGIQTSWWKQHEYVKGTWVDRMLRIIWRRYSDARAPMKLHGFAF